MWEQSWSTNIDYIVELPNQFMYPMCGIQNVGYIFKESKKQFTGVFKIKS